MMILMDVCKARPMAQRAGIVKPEAQGAEGDFFVLFKRKLNRESCDN